MPHLSCHIRNHDLESDNTLHVVGVISNPVRWQSRYRLFHQWLAEMHATPNVRVHVVEALHGDRKAECAPLGHALSPDYNYLPVRTGSEIWIKENLINLGVRHLLPQNWRYMAWIDCDVSFRNPRWALDTIHQLQLYNIVQPWSDAVDLCHDGSIHKHFKSFGYFQAKGLQQSARASNPYGHPYGHTGFAWACTRYFYENVKELLDFAILGSGDAHMAYACIGRVLETVNGGMQQGYKDACRHWQTRATRACSGLVGYTAGRIEHHFHGPKSGRQYANRWQILVRHKFDPRHDLRYDAHGLLHLVGKPGLEHAIKRYNRERCEDSIEQY